jgi:hypothetical protein
MRPETIITAKTVFFTLLALFYFVSITIVCFLMVGGGDFPGFLTIVSEVSGGSGGSLVQLLPIVIFGLTLMVGNLALAFAPRRIGCLSDYCWSCTQYLTERINGTFCGCHIDWMDW